MDLIDFVWNLRQQQQIGSVTGQATVNEAELRAQDATIAGLTQRLERLTLVTQGLFELLAERTHVTNADLLAKIGDIDRRAGAHAGLGDGSSLACPKCGHATSAHRTTCLYCGAPLGSQNPFTGL